MLHTQIWSGHHQSVWSVLKKHTNWHRLNPEELCLQETSCKAPEKLCSSAPRAKPALNTEDAHTTCWLNLVNRSELIKKIYFWHYFWPHPHFTAFYTTVAFQVGLLKHLGDVVTVLLNLDDEIRSLCGALAVVRLFVQTQISPSYYN